MIKNMNNKLKNISELKKILKIKKYKITSRIIMGKDFLAGKRSMKLLVIQGRLAKKIIKISMSKIIIKI